MEKIRLIQAGIGGMGGAWWKGAIKDNPDIDLVAIVDIADQPMNVCGDALGIPQNRRFNDLAAAIKAVEADAVLTVTPPAVHIQHAELAFGNGLHLLTEKPIGNTLDDAKRMVRLARDAGKQLVVAQNYRYHAPIVTMMRLLRDGTLGPIGHGKIDFHLPGDFRATFRKAMEFPLLLDMSIHHIDLVRGITGRNIEKVYAKTFRTDWSWFDHHPGLNMLMELEGGISFNYHGDWTARGRNTSWNGAWRIQCEHGSVELLNDETIVRSTSDYWPATPVSQTIPADPVPANGQRSVLNSFVTAIRTGTPAPTSGADNLWSYGAVCAGAISAREGRTVDVRELLNDSV
jgi:predicted dehydrogenase